MEKLTNTDLNALICRLNTSIKDNTTQEVFFMTKEEADFLRYRLVLELASRLNN